MREISGPAFPDDSLEPEVGSCGPSPGHRGVSFLSCTPADPSVWGTVTVASDLLWA